MREDFHDRLDRLTGHLAGMCGVAVGQLAAATDALVATDLSAARRVVVADRGLDAARERCEHEAQMLLAVQAPVASDLRAILAVVYAADRVERMGDLARHIAESVVRAHPRPAVPAAVLPVFEELGRSVAGMGRQLTAMLADGGGVAFDILHDADEHVDRLHEGLMRRINAPGWAHGVPAAVETALLARFYERFGDQVVSVARRLDFARTGELPV
ncbi:phosphate signaling complex PhoU family protein [Actinokineospora sp. HUAS TT18]|uniref:phosphate signaling complex PhoU family protein n=1 Tax=Actinokineospora sp. HUAS TT18 TaxID=3447451 RepID=UPI003F51CD9F